MIRRPPRSTLFPYTRSSDLDHNFLPIKSIAPSVLSITGGFGSSSVHDLKDRKSTRLNSSHEWISYAVFCLKKKKQRGPTEVVGNNEEEHATSVHHAHSDVAH